MTKKIHQILILDDYSNCQEIIDRNKKMFADYMPDYEYVLWLKDDVENLLKLKFPEIIFSYNKVIPKSYKSDIARYAIIYLYGGWYVDMYIKINCSMSTDKDYVFFRDIQDVSKTSWSVSTGFFYSKKKSIIIKNVLNKASENIKNSYFGVSPLCPTGPSLLGQELAKAGVDKLNNYEFGELIRVERDNYFSKKIFLNEFKTNVADAKSFEEKTIFEGPSFWTSWHEGNIYND